MATTQNRAQNLALGINLGWFQQGAAYGGRPVGEMMADLEHIGQYGASLGYSSDSGDINTALAKLQAHHPPTAVIGESNSLVSHFQGQAQGQAGAALSLGINLGWLQQGARANNRPVSLAMADLGRVSLHAQQAAYHGYEGYVNAALQRLMASQPVSAILGDVTALIGFFQGQL
jgi:hypothetical protein